MISAISPSLGFLTQIARYNIIFTTPLDSKRCQILSCLSFTVHDAKECSPNEVFEEHITTYSYHHRYH